MKILENSTGMTTQHVETLTGSTKLLIPFHSKDYTLRWKYPVYSENISLDFERKVNLRNLSWSIIYPNIHLFKNIY